MASPLIIAEAGLNHDGSVERAFELVEEAKHAGADAVKFQTFVPNLLMRPSDPDFDLLARLAMPFGSFMRIAVHAMDVGIEFMSTPGDLESLKFLVKECGIKRVKIGSDDLLNRPLVQAAYDTGLPVILSTGMATFDDIDEALIGAGTTGAVTLLHCVSLYPCPSDKVNLRAMETMRKRYGWDNIGYSDHTVGTLAPVAAAVLRATVIEKHIRLPNTKPIDDAVSISPSQFAAMVKEIRAVVPMLGDGVKLPCVEEFEALRKLRKGEDGLRGAA